MKKNCLILTLTLVSLTAFGQKKIDSTRQIAFVYFQDRKTNLIVIPNIDRLNSFKIYRKTKADTSFAQVAEKKKPPLPMRDNVSPYAVTWEDKENNTTDIEYKILSFDKRGNEICELKIIWENSSSKDKK